MQDRNMQELAVLIGELTSTKYMIFYTLILVSYLLYRKKKEQAFLGAAGMALNGAVVYVLKNIIAVPRPVNGILESYSYPSGHAATSAALALIIYYAFRDEVSERILIPICALFAIIVGLSRVVAGYHRPIEVVAGWALGGGLVYALYTVIMSRTHALKH